MTTPRPAAPPEDDATRRGVAVESSAPVLAPAVGSHRVHGGWTVDRYVAQHFQGAVFPLAAGLLLYGWRALIVVAVVMTTALGATAIWRRIGRRGRDLSPPHTAWLALLLSLMLPAHFGSLSGVTSPYGVFWLLPTAGLALVIVLWLLRGAAGSAVHPVVATFLLLAAACQPLFISHTILHRDSLFIGDVLDAPADDGAHTATPWWSARDQPSGVDAIYVASPASESLLNYTLGRREMSDRGTMPLTSFLRDRLPPLEDLIMAGNPGPIGTSSAIFVIVGGLFLMYRGSIDYRIPLLIVIAAFTALVVLPVPVAITDVGPRWSWLALREPSVGWAVGITFVNYQLTASPLLFMAFFLATSPAVRPMSGGWRMVYAVVLGVLSAALQLYVSTSWGPYVALLIVGTLTPLAERFTQAKPLA